jgi:hypothetical protein
MSDRGAPDLSSVQRVHLIAISGVAMTSLAGMLARRGLQVTGSDQNVYPPASTLLKRLGIAVRLGYRPENLDPPPDLVVVGNAVSRTNPEVVSLLERAQPGQYLRVPTSLVGGNVDIGGGAQFHYDDALSGLGPSVVYLVGWHEVRNRDAPSLSKDRLPMAAGGAPPENASNPVYFARCLRKNFTASSVNDGS